MPPALRDLIHQLKQRRVFRVATIYAVGAFAIIQGADPVLDMAGAPDWVARVVLVLLAIGFVLAIALSWAFDLTPDGVMRVKSTERETRGRSRSPVRPAYLGAGLLIASGIVAWFALRPERDAALDADAIAILPFDVAADPALGFLREGMVDLLAATLSSGAGVRAVDPRAAIAAWRRAASGEDGALTETAAFGVARRLGAGRLLLGSAVGTAQHLIVNVRMYDVGRGGEPVRLSTEGSADSLTTIVDDLASQLLARDSRVPEHRLAALTTTSLPALRLYLDAVRNYRLGRCADATQLLTQALEQDSTFALAAMQLLLCRGEGELTVELATGNRTANLAWAARDRLSQRDRLILASLVGFRFPEPTPWHEAVEARERAVAANPDRPELLLWLGHTIRLGVMRGDSVAPARAAELYRRALELDSTYAPVLRALARHAISTGDSATVRHLARRLLAVEPSGENADFMRWLAAAAADDARELADVRATMMGMHPTALGWIALAAINYGIDLDGAEAAITALRVSARTARERSNSAWREVELLHNRGRIADLIALHDSTQVASVPAEDRAFALATARLIQSLFYGADTTGVGRALDDATRAYTAAATAADTTRALIPACFVGFGRVAGREPAAARHALTFIRRGLASQTLHSVAYRSPAVCAAALEAWVAHVERRPDALAIALRADSVFRADPRIARGVANVSQLVLARVVDELGDPARALGIIRRRFTNDPPFFFATILREEGRLAARTGDRAGAIRAYRHYLTMRTDPDPRLQPEVDRVRTELVRLTGGDTQRR